MATSFYSPARAKMLAGGLDWVNGTYRAQLIDVGAYSFSAAHQYLSSIPAGARIGAPQALANKTITADGSADADDLTFTSVSGASVEALVIYKAGVDDTDSELIIFIDQATGFPFDPNTGNVICQWSNATARIFRP